MTAACLWDWIPGENTREEGQPGQPVHRPTHFKHFSTLQFLWKVLHVIFEQFIWEICSQRPGGLGFRQIYQDKSKKECEISLDISLFKKSIDFICVYYEGYPHSMLVGAEDSYQILGGQHTSVEAAHVSQALNIWGDLWQAYSWIWL